MRTRQWTALIMLAAGLVGAGPLSGCGSTPTEQAQAPTSAATSEPAPGATEQSQRPPDGPAEVDWESMLGDVVVTSDGSIYASAVGGIALLDQDTGEWTVVDTDDLPEGTPTNGSLPGRSIQNIASGSDGVLWAAGSGSSTVDDDEFGVLVEGGEPYRALLWAAKGACDGAQCTWEVFTSVDTPALMPTEGFGPYGPPDIGDIAVGADGTFYAALGENHLVTYDGSVWDSTTVDLQGVHPWSSSLAVDRQGVLWVGTNDGRGLFAFDGDAATQFTTADGFPSDNVFQVSAADDGAIWVATDASYSESSTAPPEQAAGIAHFDGATWTTYTPADGLLSDDGVVAAGPDGTAWVVHDEIPVFGYSYFDGTDWTAHPADGPLGGFRAVVDAEGTLWTVDEGSGLVRFDGATTTVYPSPFGLGQG